MRWIILLILMLGCGNGPREFRYISSGRLASQPQQEHHIYLDKNFNEMDKLAVAEAVDQWNYALNGYVKIDIINYNFDMEIEILNRLRDNDWLILKIDSRNRLVGDGKTLAFVNRVGGNKMWVIRDRMLSSWVNGIVMHEIGHLLGINHDDVYLMQESYKWEEFRCIDYGTVRLAGDVLGLDINRLNYCIYY